ncbi:alpha-L-fucosidase [Spirochaetia bacterium]|nr:alpha-L-fucosidase [Spirochaetia bacterium]
MTGAELQSMFKSSINLKSIDGVQCGELNLQPSDMQWWRDAKIGMFVHWGLYSILGRGEWVRHNEQIPWTTYKALADQFNPHNFQMDELCTLAKDFGAAYMVLVTKHHDGFSLWNSPGSYEGFTTFNTASHRDFVKEYTDACRKAGLRVGLYYSPMDWRFPGYFDPRGLRENAELMKQQCYAQVAELTGNYGPIDIMWYDGGWLAHQGTDASSAWFWEPVKLNKIVRQNNPKTLINPRSGWEGDFQCDEGPHEITGRILPIPWEKNMSISSSWGFVPDDNVHNFDWLIRMMVNVICRDGNWLLNVGPDKDGKLRPEITGRMRNIGAWLKTNGEAVYKTRGGPVEPVDGVFGTTYRENNVYIHILDTAAFALLPLTGYRIIACRLLSGESLPFTQNTHGVSIVFPHNLPAGPDTIVHLTLDKLVQKLIP